MQNQLNVPQVSSETSPRVSLQRPEIRLRFAGYAQGHPWTPMNAATLFFFLITVRRSNYCLELSKAQEKLKISG